MLKLVAIGLVWATAANAFPLLPTSTVNISDSWLLTDADSPVFYRHFRDKVTWAEAESVCQFHHSVLATVRNTAEFDRTRALLRQLEWTTPVWVGLRRDDGQPMFKWSTPAGATLEASEGYWHESPNVITSAPQCVTIDPAADFRWRAVDCSSTLEIHSFLCQIPVPTWVRLEHGGCLSPKWPNKEVTVQYNPQTRALEMIADCGLRGTRRIACKHNSEKDIRRLEHKLRCSEESGNHMKAATPPRPITRHRRDVQESSAAPTADLLTAHSFAPPLQPTEIDQQTTEKLQETTTEKIIVTVSPTEMATDSVPNPTKVITEAPKLQSDVDKAPSVSTTREATSQMKTEEAKTTTPAVQKEEEEKTEATTEEESEKLIIAVSSAPESISVVSSTTTLADTEERTTVASSSKMNVEIIAHIFDTSTDGNRVITVEEFRRNEEAPTARPAVGQEEEIDIDQMQNTQPLVVAKHHVVPGTPRNVPSTMTQHDPPHHPPLVIAISHHNITPGMPRIVAPPPQVDQAQAPFMHHPMVHDGHPRIVGPEEIRSAEDHVAQRRKQFLPTPLQGPIPEQLHHHAPMMVHQQQVEHHVDVTEEAMVPSTTTEVQTESDKTEEEDIEFQDEEPEALQEAKQRQGEKSIVVSVKVEEMESTEDTLNAETDEEIIEAKQRLKGRRTDEKPVERHLARSLYPFIINRLLG